MTLEHKCLGLYKEKGEGGESVTRPGIVRKVRQTISWKKKKKEQVFFGEEQFLSLSFVAPFSLIVERVVCQTIL